MDNFINSMGAVAGGLGIGLNSGQRQQIAQHEKAEQEYRAQQDVQTLVAAEEIKRDAARLERARAYLRGKTADLMAVAKDIGALDG